MAGEIAQAASGPISQVISMIGQKKRNERAYKQQRALNQQGHDLSMDMWNKTNVGAQKEHYEKAGMNPALMYGQSGATGTTSMASGGSAPAQAPMDMSSLMMGAQLALIKAQANKANADAEATRGVKTDNISADTGLKNVMVELNKIKIASENQSIEKSKAEVEKIIEEKGLIGENKKLAIQQFRVNEIEMKFKKAGINKTNMEIKSIVESIERDWEKVEIEWQKLDNEKKKTKIMEFEKEIKAKYPSIGNVLGRNANAGANWISTLFGNWDNVESLEVE
jgi:hypothetical protein